MIRGYYMTLRTHSKYKLKNGAKACYYGIANNLKRRTNEHKKTKKFTSVVKVGKKCTKESAQKWERQSLKSYRKGHGGKNPRYNKTKNG